MKKILILCALVLFCLHSFAQTKNSNTLLWRIQNNKNNKVSYLFGTIHLAQKKFIVYSDSVYQAIQNVNTFYNEVDFLNQSFFGDKELVKFFEEKGKYLDSIKHTDGWKNLIKRINRTYKSDLDPEDLESFVGFSQKIMSEYFESEEGVETPDMMLAQFARSIGKETGGLETYLLQFKMLYDVIDARISDTTLELNDEGEMLVKMKEHYIKQNLDSIREIVDNINGTYKKIVFDNRNITMSDSIARLVMNEPSFFAIGAGHLVGNSGVIELLKKKGFTLTPVYSDNKISMLVIKDIIQKSRRAEEDVKELEDTKIDVEATELPPPPPPKQNPPKVTTKPATKGKTKGQ